MRRSAEIRIAVVGTGGVGGYFGARLAAGGNPVTFVARGQHLEAIQRNGLTVQGPRGDLHLDNVYAVDSIRKVEAVDLILIAVRLWDTEEVASAFSPLAEGGTAILSLQNDVEKDDVLRRYLPTESVVGGVCYISASIARPGVVGHHGAIQRIGFGEYSGRESARTKMILEACRQAAIDADISLDIQRLILREICIPRRSIRNDRVHETGHRYYPPKPQNAGFPLGSHARGGECGARQRLESS